jgi:hypothetical protein
MQVPSSMARCAGPPYTWARHGGSGLKGLFMGRLNLDRLMTFADGSFLTISTACSKDGEFSCTIYSALETQNRTAFRAVSHHLLLATTCLSAQEQAYHWALRFYPQAGEFLKKPPYLIWHGPQSTELQ